MGVDLETWNPIPHVDGKSSHGGFCGPAVKPIALNMVGDCARDPQVTVPISGIGGIANWRDAVEFMLMGSTNVQVCTAVMRDGFRIVGDMIEGLNNYLDDRGIAAVSEIVGQDRSALRRLERPQPRLQDRRQDRPRRRASTATAATSPARMRPTNASTGWSTSAVQPPLKVDEEHCVGCNLCSMVCPVDECITMVRVDGGESAHTWRERLSVPS